MPGHELFYCIWKLLYYIWKERVQRTMPAYINMWCGAARSPAYVCEKKEEYESRDGEHVYMHMCINVRRS